MTSTDKNRVTSVKTTRGSQNPNKAAGNIHIVQPCIETRQSRVSPDAVNRLIDLGKLLRSSLTESELAQVVKDFRAQTAANRSQEQDSVSLSTLDVA